MSCETPPPIDNHGVGDVCNSADLCSYTADATDDAAVTQAAVERSACSLRTGPSFHSECAGKQASTCHYNADRLATPADPSTDPPTPARVFRPHEWKCMIVNCNAGECPIMNIPADVAQDGLDHALPQCCLDITQCRSLFQSTMRPKLGIDWDESGTHVDSICLMQMMVDRCDLC